MKHGEPPANVPPERLFRLLLGRPRPTLPIAFRFDGIAHPPLVVRALLASELNAAIDTAAALPEAIQASASSVDIAARALLAGGVRVFPTADAARDLPETELRRLVGAVFGALDTISPFYGRAAYGPWMSALVMGAKHPSNQADTTALGGAYDVAGRRLVERPDRYFGRPLAKLTDGQWMAYRAARLVFEEHQPK